MMALILTTVTPRSLPGAADRPNQKTGPVAGFARSSHPGNYGYVIPLLTQVDREVWVQGEPHIEVEDPEVEGGEVEG